MAGSTDYSFEGWMGLDKSSAEGNMVWQKFPNPKTWEETDVDIEISHCGICGSDIHTLRSGWGPTLYPYVPLNSHKPLPESYAAKGIEYGC